MLAVVVSRADRASEHIGEHLLSLASWAELEDGTRPDADGGGTYYRRDGIELREFEDLHLHLDGVAAAFHEPDLLVFASRHSGETGPLLTAHATGNFGRAEFGGEERSLARAAPNALRVVRNAFNGFAPQGYATGVECTHHGPTSVGCPSLFVELGSGEDQWADPAGAAAVARSVLALRGVDPWTDRAVVGFGGGHYAPRFDRVLTGTDWGVGHVAADWALAELGDPHEATGVLEAAFRASGTRFALVDGDRPGLASVIDGLGFECVSETWLRETTGVPLVFAERLERALCPVDEGLRFGALARAVDAPGDAGGATEGRGADAAAAGATDAPGAFVVEELPGELLDEANGVDREAVADAVDERVIAYETVEGASLVDGLVALADAADYRRVVDALAAVLEAKYDVVVVRERGEGGGGEVLVRRDAFDPELAREAGLEEGPAFGRLAAGEPVEVADGTVAPDDVRSAREHRFPF